MFLKFLIGHSAMWRQLDPMVGDFTASEILDIQLKAEEMWADGQQADQYKSYAETARAILSHQTARISGLDDPNKDNTVIISWVNTCAIEVQDCTTDCDIIGDELYTDAETYAVDLCKEVTFKINREKLRTNIYTREELAARGQMAAIKALDEWINMQAVLKLKTFAGVNVAPSPYTYNSGTNTTEVPSASYNVSMIANLLLQENLNQMNSAYYIDNGGLFVPWTNAKIDSGNLDGKGDLERINALDMSFDLRGFSKAGITEDTFMIDRSAVAMSGYNRNPTTPTEMGGKINQTWYRVQSKILPGMWYDVFYEVTCGVDEAGNTVIFDAWKFKARLGIWLNPTACPIDISGTEYQPTHVISFSKT